MICGSNGICKRSCGQRHRIGKVLSRPTRLFGRTLADALNSIADTILWLPRANSSPLAPNEIHVWATTLAPAADVLEEFAKVLSPDETERAHKFRFEKHRNRF